MARREGSGKMRQFIVIARSASDDAIQSPAFGLDRFAYARDDEKQHCLSPKAHNASKRSGKEIKQQREH